MVTKLVSIVVAGASAILPLCAQHINISSQNTLHLSDSARGATKRATILSQNDDYNVNLLQEVMKTAELDDVTPGEYYFQDSGLKGKSSYKERYAVIYSDFIEAETDDMEDYPDNNNDFARPPSGSLLEVETDVYVWFIDFHAIWGKSVGLRRDEATEMANVYTYFENLDINGVTTDKIVIAGDWNLGADDDGFDDLKALNAGDTEVIPNEDTSLTKAGDPSQPYDHFVAAEGDLTDCDLTPLPGTRTAKWWRDNVSDHRGITCNFNY